jgi:hypothetical protein
VDRLRLCVLGADYVRSADSTTAEIASTIVHEATHARLRRFSYDGNEPLRYRLEGLCTRAQLDFLARVPGEHSIVSHLEERFAQPAAFWSDEEIRSRRMDATRALLHRVPEPLAALARWIAARRGLT